MSSLPKWIESIRADDFPAADKWDQDKLIEALSIALEALRDIGSHVCHPDCNHQEVAKEALRRIDGVGK